MGIGTCMLEKEGLCEMERECELDRDVKSTSVLEKEVGLGHWKVADYVILVGLALWQTPFVVNQNKPEKFSQKLPSIRVFSCEHCSEIEKRPFVDYQKTCKYAKEKRATAQEAGNGFVSLLLRVTFQTL
ncbi:hypothetical protein P7K49_028011 [Saguinus oedipus]|uniref:Uncharacterized protein n=1 Tax=Saguinus oedipus TaxID=9490 RepID=A0ABQ9UB09_SAGOE|nr:hypothetical protein P7K49_028011 [Saguinus oedipus]